MIILLCCLTFLLIPGNLLAEPLNTSWKNGLRFESADRSIKLKFGGRIMNDWTTVLKVDKRIKSKVGPVENGTEIRRARLYAAGSLYDRLEWKAQWDFAEGDAHFKDVYTGLKKLPGIGNLRIGHFKEPFGLTSQTSSKYMTFIERGLPINAFSKIRNTGFMLHRKLLDKRLYIAGGIFRNSDNFGNSKGKESAYNYTVRVAGVPVYQENGKYVLHLGGAYSLQKSNNDEFRFHAKPEVHQAPNFLDTDTFEAKRSNLTQVEIALVLDSFSLQAEYVIASVLRDTPANLEFSGWYALASYFLTGEKRNYALGKAKFGQILPANPYIAKEPGIGAWEIAARISSLDLNDGALKGGKADNVALGLNWYLHANSRVMLNYVFSRLNQSGNSHFLITRFQVDF